GIGGGFDPHHLRVRLAGGVQGAVARQVHEVEVQARAPAAHALEQAEGAAVDVVHDDDVAAAVQQVEDGGGGRHAGGEGEAAGAGFQVRRAALVGEAGGVVGAAVLEALVFAGAGLHVGAGRVDRRHHGAGGRV